MPRILALFLCSGFVLFLLWLERKQSIGVTRAFWIPTIWLLYVASRPLAAWFPMSGATPESSPLDRAFLIVLMCGALWVLSRRKFSWSTAIKDNVGLMVLVVFMIISVLWSGIPKTSFFRWIRELQAVIMAFAVLSEPLPDQAMKSILRRTTYILIPFSTLLIKYFPEYGIEYARWTGERMWVGVAQQKNSLGLLSLIAAFFLIWSLVTRSKAKEKTVWRYEVYLEIFLLLLVLWLLRGPNGSFFYSATSFYALCAGLLVYWSLNAIKKFKRTPKASTIMATVAIIMIFGIITLFSGGSHVSFFASAAGRTTTLTDRTEVWASLLPIAMKKPLLGSGFGGFWTPATRAIFHISGAHSGYLDVLLGLGFIGFILTYIFLMASCRKAHRMLEINFNWGALIVCFIIMTAVHNITESSIDSLTSFPTAIILLSTESSSKIVSYAQK